MLKSIIKRVLLTVLKPLVRLLGEDIQPDPTHENRRKLCHVGGHYTSAGNIEFEDVRFHLSYPTFENILVENLYFENYNFPLKGSWAVFDIGANAGATCIWFARQDNVKKIYAFEPVKPTCKMLHDNLALNPRLQNKVEVFPFGLGAERETIKIPFHRDHVMSLSSRGTFDSCFEPESVEEIQVEIAHQTIEPLLRKHQDDRVFLKVDCEGAEYEILPDLAEAGLLKEVDVLIVEWHDGDFQKIVSLLEAEHFFCFIEWHRRDKWKIGIIKAVKQTL